jgi:hypothetical protein
MQMRESEPAIHGQNSQTIRGNRGNRSNQSRIRGKINRSIIREILRRIISPREVRTIHEARTTKTSGNDSSAATRSKPGVARRPASFSPRLDILPSYNDQD